jgi:competence protein ComEC
MKNRPAVKILIPYLAGIILADRFDLSVMYLWILSAALIISTFLAYKKRWLSSSSFLLVLCFLLIGLLRYEMAMIPPDGLGKILYQQVRVQGTVVKSQKERSGGSSLTVKGEATSIADPSVTMSGKIFIRSWEEVFSQKYGDVVEVEGELTRPRLPRNPGAFDYRKYLVRRGIFATMTVNSASNVSKISTGGTPFLRWIYTLRGEVERIIDKSTPPKSASVLKGVTLGDRAALSEDMYQAFLRTGTSHILAVSGLHIGIIALWTFLLCNWIRKLVGLTNISMAYIPVIPVAIVYACMVGFQTSVIRASTLVILAALGVCIYRDADIFNFLAAVALGILIYRPGAFWDAGFQLSFGAVASIAYLMPHWQRWLARIRRDKWRYRLLYRILQTAAISWSAQIGAMLIIAYTFKSASLAGVVVNLVVVPLTTVIVPIGFASCVAGLIYLPLASALGYVNHILISILSLIVSYFGGFGWSYVPIRGFSFWHIVSSIAVIVFIANLSILLKDRRRLIVAGVGVVTLLIWAAALSYDGHILEVTYLDVGQGDSAFVDLPNGGNILIDGGPYSSRYDTGERVVSPFLQHEGVSKVDLIVSSHPHNDHAGGLTYTVDNFRVGEAITGSYDLTTPTYEELRARLDRDGIKYHDAQVGTIFRNKELHVEVVSPEYPDVSGSKDSRMNNNSVVLRVTYKGVSFLFTGDIEAEYERRLINPGRDIKAAVLKVPHQGSKTSSSWEFLRVVQPAIGIISVGRWNMFGHPSPLILGRYRSLGIKTYRTDRQGAITVVTDGRRGWIRTMLGSGS